MTLDKAIKIKENHQHLHLDEFYPELLAADNLSIEALKRVQLLRLNVNLNLKLPGETEE